MQLRIAALLLLACAGSSHAAESQQAGPASTPHAAAEPPPAPTSNRREPVPPPEWAAYLQQVRAAETIADPIQRCLAYPDLPGNTWHEGVVAARCQLQRPFAVALDQIQSQLATPEGAAWLQRRFDELLDAHYAVPTERDRLADVLSQFNGGDKAMGIAIEWLRQTPDSPYARTAMGTQRLHQAWAARGKKYMADTSQAQVKRMDQLFMAAVPMLQDAWKDEPRLTPACMALAEIGRMTSDDLQWSTLPRCLKADPASYDLTKEWMRAAMPKWGGSYQMMDAVIAHVHEYGPQNPLLYALLGEKVSYPATIAKTWDESLEDYTAAALIAPGFSNITGAGRGYFAKKNDWAALAYFSQAVRFAPADPETHSLRAQALDELGLLEWALRDLEIATRDKTDMRAQFLAGALRVLVAKPAEARPYLQVAEKDPDFADRASHFHCLSYLATAEDVGSRKARECTAQLVKRFPEKGEYWGWRVMVLGNVGTGPEFQEASRQFLLHADPADPMQQAIKRHMLGQKPAPGDEKLIGNSGQ